MVVLATAAGLLIGVVMLLKQSTAFNRVVNLGATGLTPTVTISKDGAAFGSLGGSITEISNKWYKVALNTTDTNTLGSLALVFSTGTYTGDADQVVLDLPGATVNASQIGGSATAATNIANAYAGMEAGTAQSGGATNIKLRSGASAVDGQYVNQAVFILSGTGAGQTNRISAYVGSTKVATVESAWATNPDNTSTYLVLGRIG
jgi:hypothetical protein